jgi:hypothetical protein
MGGLCDTLNIFAQNTNYYALTSSQRAHSAGCGMHNFATAGGFCQPDTSTSCDMCLPCLHGYYFMTCIYVHGLIELQTLCSHKLTCRWCMRQRADPSLVGPITRDVSGCADSASLALISSMCHRRTLAPPLPPGSCCKGAGRGRCGGKESMLQHIQYHPVRLQSAHLAKLSRQPSDNVAAHC